MNIQNGNFLSIDQLKDQYHLSGNKKVTETSDVKSFQNILFEKQTSAYEAGELKFSKHAANRLTDRNISLSGGQMQKLSDAAAKAREKGIKESLVVVDELAFIVNIPNKTVVTAMGRDESQGNVFTNIDGAIFM